MINMFFPTAKAACPSLAQGFFPITYDFLSSKMTLGR